MRSIDQYSHLQCRQTTVMNIHPLILTATLPAWSTTHWLQWTRTTMDWSILPNIVKRSRLWLFKLEFIFIRIHIIQCRHWTKRIYTKLSHWYQSSIYLKEEKNNHQATASPRHITQYWIYLQNKLKIVNACMCWLVCFYIWCPLNGYVLFAGMYNFYTSFYRI